jgi:glycosyltransferase involved in cell wall biosynthesis
MRSALHVINSTDPNHGGTSVSVPALVRATAATNRYNNLLLQMDRRAISGALGQDSRLQTIPQSALGTYANIVFGGEIDNAVRRSDVIHVHGLWQAHCITTGLAAKRRRKPLVVSAHGMLEPWALRNKHWKKWIYSLLVERPNLRHAAVLRALTRSEACDYRTYGLSNPIVIIPNGVDIPSKTSTSLCYTSWPELRGRQVVLYLSRIHYKKGIDLLVKAWATVAQQFTDAHLVIAGPDFEKTRPIIEQLVRERSLSNRVTFTGAVFGDVKASLLNAASVFVLPSHSEGFSIAVLESLAAGVPVIITKECNFPDVTESESGWVISPDVVQVAGALKEALESPRSDLEARGQRGMQLVRCKYSWSYIGQQMADVYDWILGGARPNSVEILD